MLSNWKWRRLAKVQKQAEHIAAATGQQHGDQVELASKEKLLEAPPELQTCCAGDNETRSSRWDELRLTQIRKPGDTKGACLGMP